MRLSVRETVTEIVTGWDDKGTRRSGLLLLVQSQLVPGGGAGDDSRHEHVKISGSPSPCDPLMLALATHVHVIARETEANLALLLDAPHVVRGGSLLNTTRALYRAATLHERVPARDRDHWIVRDTGKRLATWRHQARVALGVDRPWLVWPSPCPAEDEDGAVCGMATLRQRPDSSIVCLSCKTSWEDPDWLGRVVRAIAEQASAESSTTAKESA